VVRICEIKPFKDACRRKNLIASLLKAIDLSSYFVLFLGQLLKVNLLCIPLQTVSRKPTHAFQGIKRQFQPARRDNNLITLSNFEANPMGTRLMNMERASATLTLTYDVRQVSQLSYVLTFGTGH